MKFSTQISGLTSFSKGALFSVAGCVLLTTSCTREEPTVEQHVSDEDPVAIQAGDTKIRLSQLQEQVEFLQLRNSPLVHSQDTFVESAVDRVVALEKARELGLDQDVELRRQWENLLIGRLNTQSIDSELSEITISEEEVSHYYQANQKRFSRPAQIHLALLQLNVPKAADEEKRQDIRERLEEARELALKQPPETRGFGAHAMTYSEEATSRFKGGDVGWLKAGQSHYRWPDEVIEAAFSLEEKHAVSPVIATSDGFYLLKKLDSREAEVRSLNGRFRSSLENEIRKTKRIDLATQIKSQWKESVALHVNEEVISTLQFKTEPASATPLKKLSPLPLSN